MGRPKGLRKDPVTGKFYMPASAPAPPAEVHATPAPMPIAKRKPKGEAFERNEMVTLCIEGCTVPCIVLGYQDELVAVQGVFDRERRVVKEQQLNPTLDRRTA
jgi:hypothetical protein